MEVTYNRQKIGLEDIEFGTGTVQQTRGGQDTTITKVNAQNLPFDGIDTLGTIVTNIQTSESNAATSESNAATSEANALTSKNNAAISESNALTSANNASTSESNAATSESNALTSANNASTSESNAATSESNASTSETNALNSANTASAAQVAVENIFDTYDDRFLGAKASDPTLDNDGNALLVGAVYYNSTDSTVRFYNGTTWDIPSTAAAQSASNASTSEINAATSESNAATSESNAATSESNALTSENNAAQSEANAAASAIQFPNSIKVEQSTDGGYPEYRIKSKNFVFGDTPETLHEKGNIKLINGEYFKDEGVELIPNGNFSSEDISYLYSFSGDTQAIVENGRLKITSRSDTTFGSVRLDISNTVNGIFAIGLKGFIGTTGWRLFVKNNAHSTIYDSGAQTSNEDLELNLDLNTTNCYLLLEANGAVSSTAFFDDISVKELTAITLPTAPAPTVETSTTTANAYAKGDVVVLDRPEKVVNGTFDTDTDWTFDPAQWGISAGTLNFTGTDNLGAYQDTGATIVGNTYVIKYEVTSSNNNGLGISFAGTTINNANSVGVHIVSVVATDTTGRMQFTAGFDGARWNGSIDNVSVKQKDEIYQAKTTTSVSDLLTDTAKFQVKSDLALQDVVLNRKHIATGATDIYTYRSLNVYGQADTNDDIMIGEGYSLVVGSKDTYTDGTYYVTLIGYVPRLNQGAYHPVFNEYGTNFYQNPANELNSVGYWTGMPAGVPVPDSVAHAFIWASIRPGFDGTFSVVDNARPNPVFYDRIYEKGLNGLIDRRIDTKQYSKAEMELKAEGIVRETREYYRVEAEQFTQTTTGTVDTLEVSDGTKYPIGQVIQIYDRTTSTVIGRRRVLSVNANTVTLDATIVKSANDYIIGGRISNQCVQGESLAIEVLSDNYKTDWLDRLAEGKELPIIANFVDDAGVSNLPDGVKTVFKFQQKAKSNLQVLKSTDSGVTWTLQVLTTHYTIDTVANTITFVTAPLSTDMIVISNIADINPIHEATPKPVEYVSDKTIASNSHSVYKKGDIVRAITGKVPVGNSDNDLEAKVLENVVIGVDEQVVVGVNLDFFVGTVIYVDDTFTSAVEGKGYYRSTTEGSAVVGTGTSFSSWVYLGENNTEFNVATTPKHTAFTLNSDDSPAAKYYSTIANDNGQALWQIEGEILEWDTVDWGDNGKFDGINLNNSDDNTKVLSARLPMKIKD